MAAPRKSALQFAAREKAMAKARELTERHEKLIDLAAEYFEQQEQADFIRSDARQKADALIAKAEKDAESAVHAAAERVKAMLDAGEARSAVAARLGISSAEVKRMTEMISRQSEDNQDAPAAEQEASVDEHAA